MRALTRRRALLGLIAGLVLGAAAPGRADLIPLSRNITQNGNADLSGQLCVEVTDLGGGVIQFLAQNAAGGVASAIQAFSIELGGLNWTAASLVEGPGTKFQFDTNYNLPGGNTLSPPFDETFAIVRRGGAANGINPGEYAGFQLVTTVSFADMLSAIANGVVRLGVHVQSIGSTGGSDSYINSTVVPEPSGLVLAVVGVGALGLMGCRRRRSRSGSALQAVPGCRAELCGPVSGQNTVGD
ncbi:MAG: hypothetical protein KatS3mg108_2332 [Isosphaeraceae bacterium]|jgi:hypothetical protein|nr:MAG: hypothetical protein KatS3mg108_2332 [Isosphaeraceae bacterium]